MRRFAFSGLALVAALIFGTATVAQGAGLVSFWNFDEASGRALDSADGHSGTLGPAVVRVPGAIGSGALLFDKTSGSWVDTGAGANYSVSNITVEAIFKLPPGWTGAGAASEDILVRNSWPAHVLLAFQGPDFYHPVAQLGWGLGGDGGGVGYEELGLKIDGVGGNPSFASIADGNFHHVVATYDQASGLKAIYLDGTLRASTNYGAGFVINMADKTTAVVIGAGQVSGSVEPFNGTLDEVGFYNTALSAAKVAQHYQLFQAGQSYMPAVPVIGTLDYSDTFTVGVGGRADGGYYPPGGAMMDVEYTAPGLAVPQWKDPGAFSFNSTSTIYSGINPYPGNTGNAGAATGVAQTGGDNASIAYGVRTDYTVSADFNWPIAIQNVAGTPQNSVAISSWAAVGDRIPSASGGLTVFFRRAGALTYGDHITLYSNGTETDTGVQTGIAATNDSWHNFAVRFNKDGNSLGLYVDQVLKSTLDLGTFAGGIYSTYSNGAVGVGMVPQTPTMISWWDNFEVGTISVLPLGASAKRSLVLMNQVEVTYSNPVQASGATNVANYTINNGNSVTGATINGLLTTVTLTLANNIDNSLVHTLTINGVRDRLGNLIATNTTVNVSVPSDLVRLQDSGADHLVVLEAEDYNRNLSPSSDGHSWVLTTTPDNLQPTDANTNYSGTGVMEAEPKTGLVNNGSTVVGPELDYKVYFPTTGTYYVWVRGVGDAPPGPNVSRSIQIGIDGNLTLNVSGFAQGQGYEWLNTTLGSPSGPIVVNTPGLHVINAWMRQDGFAFDKLLLTSNSGYTPTGTGPAESALLPLILGVARSGANLLLTWPGGGVLQSSTNAAGAYSDVVGASSPFNVVPSGHQKYYRVKQ